MQTSYSFTQPAAYEGMLADSAFTHKEGVPALGIVRFGHAVMKGNHRSGSGREAKRNVATLVGAGALITANVVNGTVNGVALTPTTFATSHAATMAAIAAKIDAALLTLGIVSVSVVSTNNIITTAEDANVLFSAFVVTAGSTQTTYTFTYAEGGFFRGVAIHLHKERLADGTVGYADTDTIAVLRKGRIWVKVTAAVVDNDDAYLVVADSGEESLFTNVSTGNVGPIGKFRTAAADNGLAILEVNLP